MKKQSEKSKKSQEIPDQHKREQDNDPAPDLMAAPDIKEDGLLSLSRRSVNGVKIENTNRIWINEIGTF